MKKFLFISVIFILFIIGNINISHGSDDICRLSLNTNNNKINKNETLEILLSISDIDSQKGVSAINGLLEYDKNVFENITYEKTSEWGNFYQLNDVVFIVTSNMEEKFENSDVLKIKLKVKEDAKTGNTSIKLSNIEVVDSSNENKKINDIEQHIEINNAITPNNDITPNNINSDSNSQAQGQENSQEIVNNNEEQNDKMSTTTNSIGRSGETTQNTSIADKILSKTGLGIASIILTLIVISLGAFFYIKYKKIH